MSSIDFDYELSNGWNRYQIMVLSELKRLGDAQDNIGVDVKDISTTVTELKAASNSTAATAIDHETRIRKLEADDQQTAGVRRLRSWTRPILINGILQAIGWCVAIFTIKIK